MLFKLSKFYCKYVVNVINESFIETMKNKIYSCELEDQLYESYLKLEKIINNEISNM